MRQIAILFVLPALLLPACRTAEQNQSPAVAYTGATIIDGSGGDPIDRGVMIVRDGRIVEVGTADDIAVPDGARVIEMEGKTIVPGIINAHGHVGNARGIEGGHYSRENIIDNLRIYARYGVTTVISLGDDKAEAVPLRHVNDSMARGRARLFIAGDVITGKTPGEAVAMVENNHRMGVDFMKIRVDDNLGTAEKMPEEVYKAVIDRSHELGYRIATHMYYLDDAKKLVEAGSDMIAHSVRDVAVDEDFIGMIKRRNVPYCATLTREVSTFVYGETPEFFSDPFFTRDYDSATVQPLKNADRQAQVRNNKNAQTYRQQLPLAMENLKRLSESGAMIVFGTDSGVPTRFMGYFEHMEMEMMSDAGLTPMEIIVSATRDAAAGMGLSNLGTLRKGNWADFLVLDENPLDDIRNMRALSAVYVGGEKIVKGEEAAL